MFYKSTHQRSSDGRPLYALLALCAFIFTVLVPGLSHAADIGDTFTLPATIRDNTGGDVILSEDVCSFLSSLPTTTNTSQISAKYFVKHPNYNMGWNRGDTFPADSFFSASIGVQGQISLDNCSTDSLHNAVTGFGSRPASDNYNILLKYWDDTTTSYQALGYVPYQLTSTGFTYFGEPTATFGGGGGLTYSPITDEVITGSGVANLVPSDPNGQAPESLSVNGSVDAQIHPYDFEEDDDYYLEISVGDRNYLDILSNDSDYYETEIDITQQAQTTYNWSNTFTDVGIQQYTVRLKKVRRFWLDQTLATKVTTFTLSENSQSDDYFLGAGGDRTEYERGVIPTDDLTTCISPSGVVEEAVCNIRSITVEIMTWAFVPSEGVLASFGQITDTMAEQFPFSYLYDVTAIFEVTDFDEPTELEITIPVPEILATTGEIPVFTLTQENQFIENDTLSTFRFLMGTMVWFALVFYLWNRTRQAVNQLR